MKKAKKIIIWLVIIVLVVFGVRLYFKSKKPVTTYTTATATRGTLVQTVSVTGIINPDQQIDLSFKTNGILKSINVNVGDKITKGQELATIDPGTLKSQLAQALAQVQVQQQTYDNMKKNRNTFSEDQRAAQKAMVEQAQAGVNVIQDQLKDVTLVSPIDGIVTQRTANPGETVVLNLNSPVISIIPQNDLIITSNIPESDISKVAIGQTVNVTLDALSPEDVFKATVYEIDPASTEIQNVVYYRIKMNFDNLDPRFKAGMSANLDIATAQKDNVITVPMRAINTDGDKKFVNVLLADNTTKKVYVQTGLVGDQGMIEVTLGLSGGEKVVTYEQTK